MKIRHLALYTSMALASIGNAFATEKIELEVVSWKGAGAEVAKFPTLIAKFEKENPDIKVKMNYMARNDMVTSIPARFQAGTPPDVIMVDREFLIPWGGNGQLRDLTGQSFIERIRPDLRANLGNDGKVYYAILEMSGMGVYTNNDLFEKAGVTEYPQTVADFTKACSKFNDAGITPMVLAGNNGGWTPFLFLMALGLTDGDIPSQDRLAKLASGEIKFSEDQSMKNAFEGFSQLIDAECFNPMISAGTDPWSVALTTFQSGRIAMLPQGLWNITPFMTDSLPENFSVQPFPSINGKNAVTVDYIGPGWAIPTDAKDVEAAKKWIDFWTKDENLSLFVIADTAMSSLDGGTSGLPESVAADFVKTRDEGKFVTFPLGALPLNLTTAMPNDVMSFMLDPKQDYNKILASWDTMVAEELAK